MTWLAHNNQLHNHAGVSLSFEAGKQLLDAYNAILSPIPMNPWPAFLPPLHVVIQERSELHQGLSEIMAKGRRR